MSGATKACPSLEIVPARTPRPHRFTFLETILALVHAFLDALEMRRSQPIGWLLTAVGRAYPAFCPERERGEMRAAAAEIVERLQRPKKRRASTTSQARSST